MNEKMTTYTKDGRAWTVARIETDATEIYKSLSADLIHKKLHKCKYIRSVADRSNYDGTRTVTVYYIDDVKRVYIVKA